MIDFQSYQRVIIRQWTRTLFLLAMLVIPIFAALDYFTVTSELFYPFLYGRLIVAGCLFVMAMIVHFSKPTGSFEAHGYIFTILVGGLISWMTVKLGGINSGYYAGLNIVVISVNLLIPWKPIHSLINGILVLAIYIIMQVVFPQPFEVRNLINNLYFLITTVFVITVVSWMRYNLVKQEYLGRQKADESQLEEIQELSNIAQRLSAGDFTINLDLEFKSTAGILLGAFQKMRSDLKNTLVGISQASMEVESFSSLIKNLTHELADGMQKQNQKADHSVATIRSLLDHIRQNSEEAMKLFGTAEQGEKRAREGKIKIEESVSGMQRIEEIVEGLSHRIHGLEDSSKKIGEIILSIVEIADQTNMLALNAAIEAARAGEQGRGFAIVAEHVGKLAERTADATRETNNIISSIQSDMQGAITAMDNSLSEIEGTMELSNIVSKTVIDVTEYTSRLSSTVREIAETGKSQAESSSIITENIESIQTNTESMASSIEEVAAVAEQMHEITARLNSLVSGFKIGSN